MSSKTFVSKNYETRSKNSWIQYGKKHRRLLIFYGSDVWDLTQFSEVHPGSKKTIQKYIFKDVEDFLFDICPMAKSRVESFKSFKIGIIQTKRDSRQVSLDIEKKRRQIMTETQNSIIENFSHFSFKRTFKEDSIFSCLNITTASNFPSMITSTFAQQNGMQNSSSDDEEVKKSQNMSFQGDEEKPTFFIPQLTIKTRFY